MKLLVTGGAGFIGSNFIHYILNKYKDYSIVNLDALTYAGKIQSLKDVEKDKRYTFVHADVADEKTVDQLFKENSFDVVVHFAAESHVDRSVTGPGIFIRTNIVGTQVLLDAAKKYNVKRFHQISTDEVYGDLPLDRPDLLFTEKTPINPSSPYSASKAAADMLVMAYYRTYGLPVTISRCSNNYGPYHFPEKLIPLTILKILKNKEIPVYGNGLNIRDWLHVYDHCSAIDTIIHHGKIGEVYNIGGNSERTNLQVVKTILKVLGKSEALISYVTDRPGHDLRYAIDASKMKDTLGWHPIYSFEKGIEQTVDWYVKNEDWWRNDLI